jgi:hypothetical protein
MSVVSTPALACDGAGAAAGTVSVIIASSWPPHAPSVQGNDLRAGAFRDAVGAPLPFAPAAP